MTSYWIMVSALAGGMATVSFVGIWRDRHRAQRRQPRLYK